MKFGQLVECDMKNIFLEKSYTKLVEKLVPDSLFLLYGKLRAIEIYWN